MCVESDNCWHECCLRGVDRGVHLSPILECGERFVMMDDIGVWPACHFNNIWCRLKNRILIWYWGSWYFKFPANGGEASLCILFVLEILCLSTKITFGLTLCAWCVFHVFACGLSVYHLSSHWVRGCLPGVYVVIEHMVNSKWFQISTSWMQKVLNTR